MGNMQKFMEGIAKKCTIWTGSSMAFFIALLSIIIWLVLGPHYNWSTDHSIFINTFTTLITFIMIFVIQRTQNKDAFALQMKINELIAAHQGCSNRLINVEDFSEEEIGKLYKRYKKLSEIAKLEDGWTNSHTIEEIADED
jgi:low affinity Fe/Cu permease